MLRGNAKGLTLKCSNLADEQLQVNNNVSCLKTICVTQEEEEEVPDCKPSIVILEEPASHQHRFPQIDLTKLIALLTKLI